MTIDEAIPEFKERASDSRRLVQMGFAGYFSKGEEEEQISEWLEELRRYRAIGTLEECQKSVEICKSMIERNITTENMEEYMKFEDECVKNGFTFESLLKAREKQMAKKPRIIGNVMICPSCPRCFKTDNVTCCPSCGQRIDFGNGTIDADDFDVRR